MKRNKRVALIGVVAVAVVGIGILLVQLQVETVELQNKDALSLQVRNLEQMVRALESGSDERDQMLTAGVSNLGLQELTAALVGTEVEVPAVQSSRLSLSELALRTGPGEMRATLTIVGTSPKIWGQIALTATGVILFDHFESVGGSGASRQAVYRVYLERIAPAFRLGWFSIKTRRWASELLRSKAIEEFGEQLQLRIPVPMLSDVALGFAREDTTFIEDTGANYVIRTTLPSSLLAVPLALQTPIPAADGLHVIATRGPSQGEPPQSPDPSASPAELLARRDVLMARVMGLVKGLPALKSAMEVTVHRGLFDQFIDQVNGLPEASRTVSLQLVSWHGRLVNEMHDVELVGKGGYYVEFDDQDSASGRVKLGQLKSSWTDRGLTLSTVISAQVDARLNVYIDPYVGGGFDFDMGVSGDAQAPAAILVDARKIEVGEDSAILLGPALRCAQFPITIQGGGSVKFGMETHELIGEEQSKPTILLTNAPQRFQLLPAVDTPNLRHPASYLEVSLVPAGVEILPGAYRFATDVRVARREGDVPMVREDPKVAEARIAAFEDEWMRKVATTCPAQSPTKFLFAGQDFGPNNEIVKVIASLARSAELTKHNAQVAWDDAETVLKDPSRLPAKVKEIAGRAKAEGKRLEHRVKRDVVKPVKKFFKKVF